MTHLVRYDQRLIADYNEFVRTKLSVVAPTGLSTFSIPPDVMFPHQAALTAWALRRGRAAIFADTGLGKSRMQISWADAVLNATGKHVRTPPRYGGWVPAGDFTGWTCCVEQGSYGHPARKATWLYAVGADLPSLKWGKATGDFLRLDEGFHSEEERARVVKTGICQRLSKRQCAATPPAFRDLLIEIARSVK